MARKRTVTIGISAYNEEKNLAAMLTSLLAQKQESFRIERIHVISDGSTDDTVNVARSYKNSRIVVTAGTHRLGKPARLNAIFAESDTDLVIILDADMVFDGTYALEALVQTCVRHPEYGLVGGNPSPLPAETFIEKAINTNIHVREKLRSAYDFESSAYAIHGSVMALKRSFYKKLHIPPTVLTDDAYIYFYAVQRNVGIGFSARSKVLYRSPETIHDHFSQATRYHAAGLQMVEIFGKEMVDKGYKVPVSVSLRGMVLQILFNPAGYAVLKMYHIASIVRSVLVHSRMNALWEYVASSKVLESGVEARY